MAIAQIALPVAAWQLFDYWVPDGLAIAAGDIVRVRLGARRRVLELLLCEADADDHGGVGRERHRHVLAGRYGAGEQTGVPVRPAADRRA